MLVICPQPQCIATDPCRSRTHIARIIFIGPVEKEKFMQFRRLSEESGQKHTDDRSRDSESNPESTSRMGRRSFMKSLAVGGAALLPMSAMLTERGTAKASSSWDITAGDAAILRFLAAAETIE